MNIQHFFDEQTATFTYVVSDPQTQHCAIIDSVLDYDMYAGRTNTTSADLIIDYVTANQLTVEWILETHAHADHLTASQYLKAKLGGKIAIGEHIKDVLSYWVPLFNTAHDTALDASQFDHLFTDGEQFKIGDIDVKVMHTPGHTPACLSYMMGDSVFVGDTILMPYVGTARADFPGGSAFTLFDSIQKLYALPEATKVYVCHDYPPEGVAPSCMATVAEHKANNVMLNQHVNEQDYIAAREARDSTLPVPQLLLPSVQVNIRAGDLGAAEDNGVHYLKIPLDQL